MRVREGDVREAEAAVMQQSGGHRQPQEVAKGKEQTLP